MNWIEKITTLLIVGVLTVVGNTVGYNMPVTEAIFGFFILIVIIVLGTLMSQYIPIKLPMVFWISLLALLSTSPISPIAKPIIAYTSKIDFAALCTPILAYAGLSVGKDLGMFKQLSWRIIVVALAVYTGTFVFATLISQIMLGLEGVI